MSQPTYGVFIGRDNTGAAAAGDHASATQHHAAPADARVDAIVAELAKIRDAIAGADGVVDRNKALRDVDALADEVGRYDPDGEALTATFARLANRVKPVAGVAAAVHQVWALVESMVNGA
jgi:hypothetical protein